MTAGGLEGAVYREVRRLAHDHADEIRRRFPKLLRRVMGYNLDDFMGDGPMNLTRALVGSEGTLAMVTEAKVNLVPLPAYKGLGVLHFTDLIECMEAAVPILEHSPSAVELVGHMIIDNCRRNPGYRHLLGHFMGDPRELLFVEFYGDSEAEVRSKLAALKSDMGAAPARLRHDGDEQPRAAAGVVRAAGGGPRPRYVRQRRFKAAALRRGHGRLARAAAGVRAAVRGGRCAPRDRGRVLRPCEHGVPPHPADGQHEDGGRRREDGGDRRGDIGPGGSSSAAASPASTATASCGGCSPRRCSVRSYTARSVS